MAKEPLLDLVHRYSRLIENGRTPKKVLKHLRGEVVELATEIRAKRKGKSPGPDGIRGEAIDIALCALDVIFVDDPSTTNAQIMAIAEAKCEKWKELYSDSALNHLAENVDAEPTKKAVRKADKIARKAVRKATKAAEKQRRAQMAVHTAMVADARRALIKQKRSEKRALKTKKAPPKRKTSV